MKVKILSRLRSLISHVRSSWSERHSQIPARPPEILVSLTEFESLLSDLSVTSERLELREGELRRAREEHKAVSTALTGEIESLRAELANQQAACQTQAEELQVLTTELEQLRVVEAGFIQVRAAWIQVQKTKKWWQLTSKPQRRFIRVVEEQGAIPLTNEEEAEVEAAQTRIANLLAGTAVARVGSQDTLSAVSRIVETQRLNHGESAT